MVQLVGKEAIANSPSRKVVGGGLLGGDEWLLRERDFHLVCTWIQLTYVCFIQFSQQLPKPLGRMCPLSKASVCFGFCTIDFDALFKISVKCSFPSPFFIIVVLKRCKYHANPPPPSQGLCRSSVGTKTQCCGKGHVLSVDLITPHPIQSKSGLLGLISLINAGQRQ